MCKKMVLLMMLMAACLPLAAQQTFRNPLFRGADPWVVRDEASQTYLWCFSEGDLGVALYRSKGLTDRGEKTVVWRAPKEGPYSQQIWAPELHFVEGRWHIYMAGSDGKNENHLAYVLRAKTEDVMGEYEVLGPMATGDGKDGRSPLVWAIDMTLLHHDKKLYALWSGWDRPGTDRQFLYIAPMKSATELSGPRVLICDHADHAWERTEEGPQGRGLNEGPQVVQAHDRTFVFYSCAASWLPSYKLGMLELVGKNPLDPKSWKKSARPAFESTEHTYGVGHSCFVNSPDGREWWHIYHSKQSREPGWQRDVMMQPFTFDSAGMPQLGSPVKRGEPLPVPSGG